MNKIEWSVIINEISQNVKSGSHDTTTDTNGRTYDVLAGPVVDNGVKVWFVSNNITPEMLLDNIYYAYEDKEGNVIVDTSQSLSEHISKDRELESALLDYYLSIPLVNECIEMEGTLSLFVNKELPVENYTDEEYQVAVLLDQEITKVLNNTLFRYLHPEKVLEQYRSDLIEPIHSFLEL